MSYPINPAVLEMKDLHISGNIIPLEWYTKIKFKDGKPNLPAITILSDIVYWYRPTEKRDERTGRLLGYTKKFKADFLQRDAEQFSEMYGLTVRQVKDNIKVLESMNILKRHYRDIKTEAGIIPNKLFLELNVKKLKELQEYKPEGVSLQDSTDEGGVRSNEGGSYVQTEGDLTVKRNNTENTTETTTTCCCPDLSVAGGKDATKGCFASPVTHVEEENLESNKWLEQHKLNKKVIDEAFKPFEGDNSNLGRESHSEDTKIDESDIYRAFASDQETTTAEIDEAIAIARKNGGKISNPIDYIKAIVQNRKNSKGGKKKMENKKKDEACKSQQNEGGAPVKLVNFGEFRKNYKG